MVSAGQGNRYGHPAQEVLKAYEHMTIYRTDSHGAIVLSAQPDTAEIHIRRTTDRQPVPLDLRDVFAGTRMGKSCLGFWRNATAG